MVNNGFVWAFDDNNPKIKAIKNQKAKEEAKRKSITSKIYDICDKYNKTFDELKKDELTKTEYKNVMDYITLCNYPKKLYPNLF